MFISPRDNSNLTTSSSNSGSPPSSPRGERKGSKKFHLDVKMGPEIFVSLKAGAFNESYDVLEKMGSGAHGEVFKVAKKGCDSCSIRAMKRIPKEYITLEDTERLFAEISHLKELDHPNIVKVYEVFEDKDYCYMITECCLGGDLFERINKNQIRDEKHAVEFIKQILSALSYCHSRGIIHTDIKPENLMFEDHSEEANLKVIDFGTSQRVHKDEKLEIHWGSPYYLAPEVLLDEVDSKCDIWAVGVILYAMLNGKLPFRSKKTASLIKEIATFQPTFQKGELDNWSKEAKDIIKKMLQPNPKLRISAQDALNHPWILRNTKESPIDLKVLSDLKAYRCRNVIKQAVMLFIICHFEFDIKEYQDTFRCLDRTGTGDIHKDDLVHAYKETGVTEEQAEQIAEAIMHEVDLNNSDSIDFSEFAMAVIPREQILTEKYVDQVFKNFDIDGNGYLTLEDMRTSISGIRIEESEWKSLFKEINKRNDGKVSKKEFDDFIFGTDQRDWWYRKYSHLIDKQTFAF